MTESEVEVEIQGGGELVEHGDTKRIFEDPESQRVEDYITGKFG